MKPTHNGIVLSAERLKQDYILLSVRIDGMPAFDPGQFMMMQVSNSYDPLLLRPFSIMRSRRDVYEFLIKIVGRGTGAIADFKHGKRILLTGPYGKGFTCKVSLHPVIAAGGVGIASVFAFSQQLSQKGVPFDLLYGAKTADELVMLEFMKQWKPLIATDDGSSGYRGTVTGLLKKKATAQDIIFACGPMPMLESIKRIAVERTIKCYISLEARMACGFGVCLGCTVFDIKGTTRRVCKDGPVFDAREVSFGKQDLKGN